MAWQRAYELGSVRCDAVWADLAPLSVLVVVFRSPPADGAARVARRRATPRSMCRVWSSRGRSSRRGRVDVVSARLVDRQHGVGDLDLQVADRGQVLVEANLMVGGQFRSSAQRAICAEQVVDALASQRQRIPPRSWAPPSCPSFSDRCPAANRSLGAVGRRRCTIYDGTLNPEPPALYMPACRNSGSTPGALSAFAMTVSTDALDETAWFDVPLIFGAVRIWAQPDAWLQPVAARLCPTPRTSSSRWRSSTARRSRGSACRPASTPTSARRLSWATRPPPRRSWLARRRSRCR